MIIGEYSLIITASEANNYLSINTQVIKKGKQKALCNYEKILFHQKRANDWQPFCLANQSGHAILYNNLTIYTTKF